MDTRQLAAFCEVVERRSFSQAAERLGVTQPAVSLQVRALEKRLGVTLLDRSGRRVEPTEAGWRLYRGSQRLLSLEEQLLDEIVADADGELAGTLSLGASTGPAAIVVPQLLCEFQAQHPAVHVSLEVHDTQWSPPDLLNLVASVAHYEIGTATQIPAGQSVGLSEHQRVEIQHQPSRYGDGAVSCHLVLGLRTF